MGWRGVWDVCVVVIVWDTCGVLIVVWVAGWRVWGVLVGCAVCVRGGDVCVLCVGWVVVGGVVWWLGRCLCVFGGKVGGCVVDGWTGGCGGGWTGRLVGGVCA